MLSLIPETFVPFIALFVALLITYAAIPSLVKVARKKHLFDTPDERTAHKTNTPTLGGVAIFAGLLMAVNLLTDSSQMSELQYIVAAIIVIFFIGIKDDILVTAPLTKMFGQLLAAAILVFLADIRFTSLHGFYGITAIDDLFSYVLTVFVFIVIINGVNLIDGIDGLASGIGIVTGTTFAIWFFLAEAYSYAILAAALVGALMAFFRYNVFSLRNKIFMGDTGSLIVGLVLAVFVIRFNELNTRPGIPYHVHAAPAVSFGILIVPLFDTLRVMFIRIIIKRSPFQADKNHIHHKLLDLGFSHKKATFTILLVNVFFIIFVFSCQFFEILRIILLLILLGMIFSYIPIYILERLEKKKKNTNHEQ